MSNSIAGFTTSSKTRPLIISKMEEFVRNGLITVYSSRLVNEMKTFVWNNGKPEAMRSYNDDLILSCAIGCWVRDTALINNQKDVEYSKVFLSSMSKSSSNLETRIPGMLSHKDNKLNKSIKQHKKVVDQFPWLLKG